MVLSKLNDSDSVGIVCLWKADCILGARRRIGKMIKNCEFPIDLLTFKPSKVSVIV
jgi:hypothetical protein